MRKTSLILGLALLAGSEHVLATAGWSANASVSGVSYSLVDLDPNDGITPWIQVGGNRDYPSSVSLNVDSSRGNGSVGLGTFVMGTLLNANSSSLSSDYGDATAQSFGGQSGLSASADPKGHGDLKGLVNGVAGEGGFIWGSQSYIASSTDGYTVDGYDLMLSPHTALVVTGNVNLSTLADANTFGTALQGADAAINDHPGSSFDLISRAYFGMTLRPVGAPLLDSKHMPVYDVSESAFSATTVGRETAMRPFGYSDVRSVSQSFSFRLDNADESTMPAFLAFQLSSSTDLPSVYGAVFVGLCSSPSATLTRLRWVE